MARSWWVVAAGVLALMACSSEGGSTTAATAPATLRGDLLVSAAASLTDAFAAVEAAFEDAHAEVDVLLNLGASSSLREQILDGAPVDVFASANTSSMDQVVAASLVEETPRIFAENLLQIAVPVGNPAGVAGLADLARPELLIGLCAEGVPCGDFAREALATAGVTASIDSNEPDVRALLTKIAAGELDAGITYVTDVASAGGTVDGVDIPEDQNVVAAYPIAILAGAPNPDAAEAFVAFVLSAAGRAILDRYGFAAP